MERAFERKLTFDPEKGIDYNALPTDPDFRAWLNKQLTEDCDDCYDEEDESIPKFSIPNPLTKETE